MVAMGAALRGLGQFKPGMIVSSATILLNMALAPFLIFGWGTGHPLGVAGAAISTFVAIVVGVIWLTLYFLDKDAFLRFTPRDWAPQFGMWKRMLAIGLPSGMEFALMALYMVVVYAIIKPFGAEAQAGFGIGGRVVQACFMPVVALGFAVAPVAGQNVGAKLGSRVRETYRSAAMMSMAVTAVLTLFCYAAAPVLIGVFSSDPRVIGVGTEYLQIVAWTFVASGLNFENSSMYQALGNTVPSLATSAVRMTVVIIPTIMLSSRTGFAMRWIWYLSIASVVVQLALGLALLRREMTRKLGSVTS
jgi:putative MATE family efflux protein